MTLCQRIREALLAQNIWQPLKDWNCIYAPSICETIYLFRTGPKRVGLKKALGINLEILWDWYTTMFVFTKTGNQSNYEYIPFFQGFPNYFR